MGLILGSLAVTGPGSPGTAGVMQCTAVSISTGRGAWAEPDLAVLDPFTSCPPLPCSNIFPVRFGETPRSPPDVSTNHASSWIHSIGVPPHLLEVPRILPCIFALSVQSCPLGGLAIPLAHWSHMQEKTHCAPSSICKLSF